MNPDVNIFLDMAKKESLNNSVRVTIIATGFDKVACEIFKGCLPGNLLLYKP